MPRLPLLRMTSAGLYCEAGGFHIDPCGPVQRAVITHAHADHLVRNCRQYLTANEGVGLVQARVGPQAWIDSLGYGEPLKLAGVTLSLHPAGHILGSAQVRVEAEGEVWVVTGDYKTTPEPTCAAFEPVRCHTLITESTFAHPVFRWPDHHEVVRQIEDWWRSNQQTGRASLLYAYALGKAQRILAALDPSIGPIAVGKDVAENNAQYEQHGRLAVSTVTPSGSEWDAQWPRALCVVAPSSRWRQPFPFCGPYATAFASGWMLLPDGPVQRRVERGFVLSDHPDHAEIHQTIAACGAERIGVCHGYIEELVTELRESGRDAFALRSPRCGKPPRVVR